MQTAFFGKPVCRGKETREASTSKGSDNSSTRCIGTGGPHSSYAVCLISAMVSQDEVRPVHRDGREMFCPRRKKWPLEKVAAAGTQESDPRGKRNQSHTPPQDRLSGEMEKPSMPTQKHTHKPFEGSTILFSVIEKFRLLLKNKNQRNSKPPSHKAENSNSVI